MLAKFTGEVTSRQIRPDQTPHRYAEEKKTPPSPSPHSTVCQPRRGQRPETGKSAGKAEFGAETRAPKIESHAFPSRFDVKPPNPSNNSATQR
jgi:hypothetical protein